MRLKDCHSFTDFRELARRRLPSPIFNYIDGAADDESTYERNTKSFEDWRWHVFTAIALYDGLTSVQFIF